MHTMPSHSLKSKHCQMFPHPLHMHLPVDPPDPTFHHLLQPQPRPRRTAHISPVMLSDPLSSPSSDAQSFDEDDMYGSDPDVETISLRPLLQSPESESPAAEMDDPLVLLILLIATDYFIQDAETIAQFDTLNMSLNQSYAMLSALYVTAELCTLSTSSEEDGDASVMSSPQDDAAGPEAQDIIDDDGVNFDS